MLGGGKFANGAVTGAYSMLFNGLMHPSKDATKLKTFEKGLRNILQNAKVGDVIDSKNLQEKYGIPKDVAGLVNSFTVISESSIEVEWSKFKTMWGIGFTRFKNGTINIQNVYSKINITINKEKVIYKGNMLYLTGGALMIKDGKNVWSNLYLHDNWITPYKDFKTIYYP